MTTTPPEGAGPTEPPSGAGPSERLDRFDRVERGLHWANAVLFAVLMATAAILYVGPLSALVGRRGLVRQVHVVAGLALPVPVVAALAGPWRRRLRADLTTLNRWDDSDRRWLRSLGRDRAGGFAKFHPGQKLNTAFTAGASIVLLATGSVMHWFEPFPVEWRTGATFVHDWLAIAVFVVVAGHLRMALSDRHALRAMVRGWVPAEWARLKAPRWSETPVAQQPGSRREAPGHSGASTSGSSR
ncbi:MAG: cytochrome b/b6 domain-containing protein [Acidimicrobiales bacterium]